MVNLIRGLRYPAPAESVRRELRKLRSEGLVERERGKHGRWVLAGQMEAMYEARRAALRASVPADAPRNVVDQGRLNGVAGPAEGSRWGRRLIRG